MNSAILSIIIPVYNVENYLTTCLDSVVGYETDNVEIIVVNDGSTDNSLVVCNDYEKKYDNVHVISQSNQGLSRARNTGIKKASGEYILFLDSDDFLKDGTLIGIITEVKNNKKNFFLGRAYQYYVDSNTYTLCQIDYSSLKDDTPCQHLLDLHKKKDFWFAAWLIVINRQFLLDNELFFKTGIYHEDELWVPSVFVKAKNMGFINYGFYCYRMEREGSIVASPKIKREFDKLIVVDELSSLVGNNSISNHMIKDRQSSLVFGILLSLPAFVSHPDYAKLVEQLSMHLGFLKKGKYYIIYIMSKLLGINYISLFLKLLPIGK